MPNEELANLLRTIIKEELKPIEKDIKIIKKEQAEMKKDQKLMRTELRNMWEDIKKLDKRLIAQEEKAM